MIFRLGKKVSNKSKLNRRAKTEQVETYVNAVLMRTLAPKHKEETVKSVSLADNCSRFAVFVNL